MINVVLDWQLTYTLLIIETHRDASPETAWTYIWYIPYVINFWYVFVFIVMLLSSRNSPWVLFFVHRAVHPNIISLVKPNRCTIVSNLFYFGMTLYMFRTVLPSIIRSPRLMMIVCHTDTAVCLASRQQYLFDKCLLLYVQSWTPDDGRKDRPKYVDVIPK